jgi:hypothetical protein
VGTIFEDACAAASNAVDLVYADKESWQYMPMASADPNARKSPDPARAALPIQAAFFDPFARAFSNMARKQGVKPERPGHASSRPVLDLAIAQLPYQVIRGDRVRRGKDQSLWEIAEVRPDGVGVRSECDLNLLTAGS